ncbi:MAG TPA: hypothetical protein VG778_06550, partial [Blastocatellia bacterium]|nr:hypothetical protein [Blastocatellia bacterium]
TVPDSTIDHAGIVRVRANGKDSTTIQVKFYYSPPAGQVGHTIASLLAFDPKTKIDEDLAALKSFLEATTDTQKAREVFAGERKS